MQDKDIIQGGTVAPRSVLPHQSCRSLSCSPDKVRQLYIFLSKSGHPSGLSRSFSEGRNGHSENERPKEIVDIRIKPEVFASENQEMLQDLIREAVNEASRRVDEERANQIKNLAGGIPGMAGMRIPGLF